MDPFLIFQIRVKTKIYLLIKTKTNHFFSITVSLISFNCVMSIHNYFILQIRIKGFSPINALFFNKIYMNKNSNTPLILKEKLLHFSLGSKL